MLFAFLSIGTLYNISHFTGERRRKKNCSFAFHVRCSFNVICDLNFSKDHSKFALEINRLSCGYQIWCYLLLFHALFTVLFGTSGNLFSWFVQKDYKETDEYRVHTQIHSVRPFNILCMWKMWRKKRKSFPYNPIIYSDLMKHDIVCCCRRSYLLVR